MKQSNTNFLNVSDRRLKKGHWPLLVTFDLEVTLNMTKSWGFLRSCFHASLVKIGQDGAKLCQFLKRCGGKKNKNKHPLNWFYKIKHCYLASCVHSLCTHGLVDDIKIAPKILRLPRHSQTFVKSRTFHTLFDENALHIILYGSYCWSATWKSFRILNIPTSKW